MEEFVGKFLATLRKTQFALPAQMVEYQRGLLEGIIRHARRHVPFYRDSRRLEILFRADDTIDWERWREIPPLTRKTLQEAHEQLKSEQPPANHGQTFALSTAGSTGEPVKVLAPELARRWAWAALRLRDFEWHRIDTSKRLAFLRGYEPGHFDESGMRRYPAWNEAFGRLAAPGERIELSSVRPAFELVETIAALRPGYLQALPTVLELMVAHDRRHLLSDIALAAVFSFGERLEREVKRDAEAHLRCPILELYGTAECGYLAGSCPHCGGLHLHAEVALVEAIDDAGAPAQPGEIGRVLVTPFYNYVMPLIRYDHGDSARVSSKACQITLPAFDEILGKRRPPFVFPGGRQIRPTLPPGWVIECLGAESYQVAQVAPDRCELRIVPGTLAPEQMRFDELTRRIRSMWWEGLQVDYRIVDALRSRSERSKLQVFVQEMPDQG